MTKEQYESLRGKTVQVDAQTYHLMKCQLNTFRAYGPILNRLCPKCREAYLADGYVCSNCGYDSSYPIEES